jgi:hypothetical protein
VTERASALVSWLALAGLVAGCSSDGGSMDPAVAPLAPHEMAGAASPESSGVSSDAVGSDAPQSDDMSAAPPVAPANVEARPTLPPAVDPGAPPGEDTVPDVAVEPAPDANPPLLAQGVRWLGRVDVSDPEQPRFAWSETGFVARFEGTALEVLLDNDDAFVFRAVIDGEARTPFAAQRGVGRYVLAENLTSGVHVVELRRQTEAVHGTSRFMGVSTPGGNLLEPPPPSERLLEVIGASVSAGFGALQDDPCGFSFATESSFDAFPGVAARELGADLAVLAISGRGVTRNDNGSTDNTMPQLFERVLPNEPLPWSFRSTPQVAVINLGKNDFATGDPGAALIDGFVELGLRVRQRYAEAFIVITTGPNLGGNHARQIEYARRAIELRRAAGDDRIELLDWDEIVPGEIGCSYHPNQLKQREMGQQLAALIRARLAW